MKSRAISVLAAIAFVVAPLTVQAQYQDQFKLTGSHDAGSSVSPYVGAFAPYTSTFDAWCVDHAHTITIPSAPYNVWVSGLTGDLSHTRLGNAGALNYEWSANLAARMDWWVTLPAPDAVDVAIQNAIWALMGGVTPSGANLTTLNTFVTTWGGTLSLGATFWAVAPALSTYDNWSVITCDPGVGVKPDRCSQQEFIYESGPPSSTVPEPATLTLLATGLVGMFAAGRKRRRNQG